MSAGDRVKVLKGHWAAGQCGTVTDVGPVIVVRLDGDFAAIAECGRDDLYALGPGTDDRRKDEE
jgi:hypothetical protein